MFKINDLVRGLSGALYVVKGVYSEDSRVVIWRMTLVNVKSGRKSNNRNPRWFTLVGHNYKELPR